MRKIIIIIFIVLDLWPVSAFSQSDCGRGTSQNELVTWCTGGDLTIDRVVIGFYVTQAEALSEAQAGLVALKAAYPNYNGTYGPVVSQGAAFFGGDPTVWSHIGVGVTRCGTTGRYGHFRYYFFQKTSWIDENENCILDSLEYPESCENNYYQIIEEVRNDQDELLYAKVQISNGGIRIFGNPNAMNNCLINNLTCSVIQNSVIEINPETGFGPFNINNELCDLEDDLAPLVSPDPGDQESDTPTAPSGDKGSGGEGYELGDGDSDLLAKIANNTGAIENNTDGLQASADSIEAQLKLINNNLQNMNKGTGSPGGISESPSNSSNNKRSALDGLPIDTEGSETEYGFTSDDVGEPTAISTILENIKDNNPITGFLSKIDITSSDPQCSISGEFNVGTTPIEIEFSFCQWEAWIDFMGQILYLLAAIYFLIIIFM